MNPHVTGSRRQSTRTRAIALTLSVLTLSGCERVRIEGPAARGSSPDAKTENEPRQRLGPVSRAQYRLLVRSHTQMGPVLLEAQSRLDSALAAIRSHGGGAGPFGPVLGSSEAQLSEAIRTYSEAARYKPAVLKAARSGFESKAYDRLHNAVTSAGHRVLGLTSIVGTCLQLCEDMEASGEGSCDPGVIAAVQPILDLKEEVLAALP